MRPRSCSLATGSCWLGSRSRLLSTGLSTACVMPARRRPTMRRCWRASSHSLPAGTKMMRRAGAPGAAWSFRTRGGAACQGVWWRSEAATDGLCRGSCEVTRLRVGRVSARGTCVCPGPGTGGCARVSAVCGFYSCCHRGQVSADRVLA